MKIFMDNNFLLKCETAKILHHNYAKNMPIYDYHCHVNVNEIWEDKKFDNIMQVLRFGTKKGKIVERF